MKQIASIAALIGVWLFSSGAGCSSKNNDPQPVTTSSKIPTTLNTFDAYMVGTWEFQTSNATFKKDGKGYGLTKSDSYHYTTVFSSDHIFTQSVTVTGPTGPNVTNSSGTWATSTTAGSKPAGSFAYPTSGGPSGSSKPALPLSFILKANGSQEICYIVFFNENDIAFDWLSSDGGLETWEVWTKTK